MICIVCDCTDDDACVDEIDGVCEWVFVGPELLAIHDHGLCTFCTSHPDVWQADDEDIARMAQWAFEHGLTKRGDDEPLVQLVSDAQANEFLKARRAGA